VTTEYELVARAAFGVSPEIGLLRHAIHLAYAPGTRDALVAHETLSALIEGIVRGEAADEVYARIHQAGREIL
jgi:hypothetical protein